MKPVPIALVTPWPPDHSGIADFARDLALGLVEVGHIVTVYTRNADAVRMDGVDVVCVPADWDGRELESHPFRLYQLGNHIEFHGWMLNALAAWPGVVQLHDIVLHHLLIGLTCAVEDWKTYLRVVRLYYGDDAAERAELPLSGGAKLLWETPEVVDYPFFEFFVEHALGIVVHSHFAQSRIAGRLPRIPLCKVDQAYRMAAPAPRSRLRRIGVFGGIQENKRLDWILQAFEYLGADLDGIEVTVVGTVETHSEALLARARGMAHLKIRFVGRVDEAEFLHELAATDLCIALRHPTMGETSAVVMRALQLGVPTIVNDTGWYAELPAAVLKAPLARSPDFLASRIHQFVKEPGVYADWATACSQLPMSMNLSHQHMCTVITDFMQSFRAERFVTDLVARHLVDLGFIGDESERGVLEAIAPRAAL